ncbi:hypothetical protein DTO195F2_5705 [Paecilomyces variotii]|nr:hypothetical protein DTO195F2_5705 [Paecilomyces variotii]
MNEELERLLNYSACEISDALLTLGVPGAGFLPDIGPINTGNKVVAPAVTVLFVPRASPSFPTLIPSDFSTTPDSNIPDGSIYADMALPDTIVVMSQPRGARTATMGGLMAARMRKIGVKGILVDGRVRDVKQLRELVDIPVWARATSIVATRGECRAHAVNVPIHIGGTRVEQRDIVMLDPEDGCAVCIPKDKLGLVLEMVPKFAVDDETKMQRVMRGMKVEDAIKESI